jgi:hypothetical protein
MRTSDGPGQSNSLRSLHTCRRHRLSWWLRRGTRCMICLCIFVNDSPRSRADGRRGVRPFSTPHLLLACTRKSPLILICLAVTVGDGNSKRTHYEGDPFKAQPFRYHSDLKVLGLRSFHRQRTMSESQWSRDSDQRMSSSSTLPYTTCTSSSSTTSSHPLLPRRTSSPS